MKELLFALVPGARELDAFEREARLLQSLSHPRIPRFVGSFREGEGVATRLYLVQEFVEGESLAAKVDRHRFDEREARSIARQVLEILAWLHSLSPAVLHRDLKPANLLQRPDGSLVLVDFGAARDLLGDVTHQSTLVGTVGYMPPEQHGGTVDATCDLYALGATLLHLLSRRPPHQLLGPDARLQVAGHVNASRPFVEWLQRLVAFSREDRFPSAQRALEALAQLDVAHGRPVLVSARSRAGLAAALAGGTILLVGGAVAFLLLQPPPRPSFQTREPAEAAAPAPPPAPATPPRPVALDDVGEDAVDLDALKEPLVERARPRSAAAKPDDGIVFERVRPAGAARGFWITERFEFAPGLAGEYAPRGSCPEQPVARLTRVAAEPRRGSGEALLGLDLELLGGEWVGCLPDAVRLRDPAGVQTWGPGAPLRPAGGVLHAEFDVRPDTRRVRLVVGTEKKPGFSVLVDLEGRRAEVE